MTEPLKDQALLSELEPLVSVITRLQSELFKGSAFNVGQIYCPTCRRYSRVWLSIIGQQNRAAINSARPLAPQVTPSAWLLKCAQCDTRFTVLIFSGPDGSEVAVFSSVAGGITTPRTPPPVAYYLDQAHRAEAAGANSAAVVMFRAALEHVLYGFGYTQGTCGKKIKDLEDDLKAGAQRTPRWARDLSPDDLRLLKELGDGAVHANDGDTTKQSALDR